MSDRNAGTPAALGRLLGLAHRGVARLTIPDELRDEWLADLDAEFARRAALDPDAARRWALTELATCPLHWTRYRLTRSSLRPGRDLCAIALAFGAIVVVMSWVNTPRILSSVADLPAPLAAATAVAINLAALAGGGGLAGRLTRRSTVWVATTLAATTWLATSLDAASHGIGLTDVLSPPWMALSLASVAMGAMVARRAAGIPAA